jgi:stage V sporulation protein AA
VWGVNVLEKTVYIRMRNRVLVKPDEKVYLLDIAQIIAPETVIPELKNLMVHHVSIRDKNIIIIDVMKVIRMISNLIEDVEVQTIFILIWFLLFFGSAMAIMNFHDDVSMRSVQEKLYKIITGVEDSKPWIFQIPYSIGLGLGMILFFNHVFQKRINEEPSPLEVEMFNYQMDLDNYVIIHENKESIKRTNDD